MNKAKVVRVDEKTFLEGVTLERKLNSTFKQIFTISYLGLSNIELDNHTYYRCHRFLVVGNNE